MGCTRQIFGITAISVRSWVEGWCFFKLALWGKGREISISKVFVQSRLYLKTHGVSITSAICLAHTKNSDRYSLLHVSDLYSNVLTAENASISHWWLLAQLQRAEPVCSAWKRSPPTSSPQKTLQSYTGAIVLIQSVLRSLQLSIKLCRMVLAILR